MYKKMQSSKKFDYDMNHFKREKAKSLEKGVDTEEYSLQFLINIMNRYLAEEPEDGLLDTRKVQLTGKNCNLKNRNDDSYPAARATDGTPSPKPKAKAKSKAGGGGKAAGKNGAGNNQPPPPKAPAGANAQRQPKSGKPCYYHQNALANGGDDCR